MAPVPPLNDSQAPTPSSGFSEVTDSLDDQLLALLSSSHFTVASYLNLAFENTASDPEDLSQRMAELALSLQLQTQSCHEDIGKIGAELQAILPRCVADIGRVGVGLQSLHHDASSLLQVTLADEDQGGDMSSLETLSTLYALQANLSRTKEVLNAAATWDHSLAQMAALLASHQINNAVALLVQLENGERALRGMPNPTGRKEQLDKARNQVASLLQPQLQHALQNMNTRLAPLQQCVSLYSQLGQNDILTQEYVKIRPTSLHKSWFDYDPKDNLQEFIGSWLDSVLSLLTEERRQATTIFGAAKVPEVTLKVFRECFRPIMGSFKSRLEAICPTNPTATNNCALDVICVIYESILRFLSLAYDSLVSGWIDLIDNKTLVENSNNLHQELMIVFKEVASPFVPYQQQFAALEGRYLTATTQLPISEINATVGEVHIDSLPSIIEQLKRVSIQVFSFAEGSISRFEVLSAGYAPQAGLKVVDKVISMYTRELATAIQTVSGHMENTNLFEFDDSTILGALGSLLIAGNFVRRLTKLEEETRERLSVLISGMLQYTSRVKEVEKSYLLQDSLTAFEIDLMLAKSALCDEQNAAPAVLQRIVGSDLGSLYPEAVNASKELVDACVRFVFDMLSALPRHNLKNMASRSAWSEGATSNFASYGALPQQYVTDIGEHMLALVQTLEPFASETSSIDVTRDIMQDIRYVAIPPWKDLLLVTGSVGDNNLLEALMDSKKVGDILGISLVDEGASDEEDGDSEDVDKDVTHFCNKWLDVVGLAVTGRFLEQIMRIPKLSRRGCEQLNADLNYLVNVFSALGLNDHPHPLLAHIAELLTVDEEALNESIMTRDKGSQIEAAIQSIEDRLAAMKGASY